MAAEATAPSQRPTLAKGRVLLVDDNDALRRAMRRGLNRAGHVVVEATNGREAIALVASEDFDLVVSDVRMPDVGGVELLQAIHERDGDLPVLLVSGDPDLATAMKAVEFGAFEYLAKPVELEKLQASVQRALERRRLRLEASRALKAQSGERPRALPAGLHPETLTGAILGGRYRVGAMIGKGGMGAVYEAERADLAQMPVAVKVLHPSIGARSDLVVRFRREAETVAALDHPNIVRILDFQMPEGEPAFLVMERLHGAPLGDTIANEGCFPVERAAFVASQVLAALGAAHRAGIVHRDLKPDNVFLTALSGSSDVVKLLDFGVAKLMGATRDEKLTQTGAVMGTPAYMAPEQARGATVDPRCDLYAVGCLLYETVSGRPPYVADNYNALICAVLEGEPAPLESVRPEVDPEFAAVVARAMSKEPSARYPTADAMVEALARWVVPSSTPGVRAARRSAR